MFRISQRPYLGTFYAQNYAMSVAGLSPDA